MPTWAANSRARLSRDELHQLRWLLGLVLVLLAFWTLFGLEIGGLAWRAAFFVTAATAFIWPGWPGHIPDWIRYWSLVLGGGALLIEIIATRFDVLSGLVLMISLLTLSRGLQYRRLREDWQLVLLCLFIIVLSGVLTLDLLFGLQILLFTVFTMALLFVMNLLERDAGRALTADDWRNFRWRQFAGRVWHALDLRQVLQAAALFTGLVLVGTLIFVAMPRYQFEQSFNFGGVKGSAGFHENIMYSEKWSLGTDDTVAFRVDPPPNFHLKTTPYWRMVVLDDYIDGPLLDDNGFVQSPPMHDQKNEFHRLYQYPGPDDVVARPKRAGTTPMPGTWKFYLEGNISDYLPILGTFDQLTFSSTQSFYAREDMQVYRIEQTSPKVLGYEIANMTMDDEMPPALDALPQNFTLAAANEKRAQGHALQYPYTYFSLPKDKEDRNILDGLVAQIKGARTNMSVNDFKIAVEDYLRENHPASMSVDMSDYQGPAHDLLVRWLDTRNSPGWCEYFAGAFVLLARDAGYPARVVVGYKGAVYNSVENYYSVLQSDAHAWAEIFDGGQSRWIRVDPTPGGEVSPGDTAAGVASGDIVPARGWNAYIDSLRMIWYRRVINFDQSDQAQIVDTLEQYGEAQAHSVGLWFTKVWQKIVAWLYAPLSKTRAFVLGLLLAAGVLAWWRAADLRNAWLRLSGNRWLGRMHRMSPVRISAGRWLRRFEPVWLAQSAELPPAEQAAWSKTRGELLALRYGPPNPSANPAQTFKRARQLLRSANRLHATR